MKGLFLLALLGGASAYRTERVSADSSNTMASEIAEFFKAEPDPSTVAGAIPGDVVPEIPKETNPTIGPQRKPGFFLHWSHWTAVAIGLGVGLPLFFIVLGLIMTWKSPPQSKSRYFNKEWAHQKTPLMRQDQFCGPKRSPFVNYGARL